MKEKLRLYVESLINDVPHYVYENLLYLFCIGAVIILAFKGKRSIRWVLSLLLIEYVFLVYWLTVISRTSIDVRKYTFTPFWSYDDPSLFMEIIMNILLFLPIGLLLGFVIKGLKWWQVLMIGGGISFSIEMFQFTLMKGFSEVDDVMHNTMGCMIGYGIYSLIRLGNERVFG